MVGVDGGDHHDLVGVADVNLPRHVVLEIALTDQLSKVAEERTKMPSPSRRSVGLDWTFELRRRSPPVLSRKNGRSRLEVKPT